MDPTRTRGAYGEDTLYYGRGAGAPTGVAVVGDVMSAARDIQYGSRGRTPPFGYQTLREGVNAGVESGPSAYYLRFLVND